mmetsp:Transcript_69173/g.195280  ORF Transcript_69173/g.195280 Transcript_69173/m.195280 type:complete len:96 (-) Transcript_69173:23-310(-)
MSTPELAVKKAIKAGMSQVMSRVQVVLQQPTSEESRWLLVRFQSLESSVGKETVLNPSQVDKDCFLFPPTARDVAARLTEATICCKDWETRAWMD